MFCNSYLETCIVFVISFEICQESVHQGCQIGWRSDDASSPVYRVSVCRMLCVFSGEAAWPSVSLSTNLLSPLSGTDLKCQARRRRRREEERGAKCSSATLILEHNATLLTPDFTFTRWSVSASRSQAVGG